MYICTTLYKKIAWSQFSCNMYTHSTYSCTASLEESASPHRLAARRTWERTIDCPSYNAVGEALKSSEASIPLLPGLPGLGSHREATPPRGDSVSLVENKARLPAVPWTDPSSFIKWLAIQRSPFVLGRPGLLDCCWPRSGWSTQESVSRGEYIRTTWNWKWEPRPAYQG